MSQSCILCGSPAISEVKIIQKRQLQECLRCKFHFVIPSDRPDSETERQRYEKHQNDPSNKGYQEFRFQAIKPALAYISRGERILDFGCGPQPALSQMLNKQNIPCENYDPYFHPTQPIGNYDIIFSTEVWEHFHHPERQIAELVELLKPKGKLVVMTEMLTADINPEKWHYLRDPTHVCFYTPETFQYLADKHRLEIIFSDERRVVIFKKSKYCHFI